MEADELLFWRASPHVRLSAPEIARDLIWGEEVDGLIDLPVREMLDRLKSEFPQHDEKAGLLTCRVSAGLAEVTWTWQHLRIRCHDMSPADQQRLINALESFDCTAYEHKG